MESSDLKRLLAESVKASLSAGDAILKVYQSDFAVETKDDRSPLTLADKQSHEIISGILEKTNLPVLSEEGKDIPYSVRRRWEYFWLVDPLDGTKEFVRRNGEFTVNVALMRHNRPVLGVIFVPVTRVLYWACEGMGAFRASDPAASSLDELRKTSTKLPVAVPARKFTVVASRSHLTPETEAFIAALRKDHGEIEFVSSGSSIKICLVAEGRADVYPRCAPTMEWDTAAGQAIAEQSGAKMVDPNTGSPMLYNKENLRNGWFVVSGANV